MRAQDSREASRQAEGGRTSKVTVRWRVSQPSTPASSSVQKPHECEKSHDRSVPTGISPESPLADRCVTATQRFLK